MKINFRFLFTFITLIFMTCACSKTKVQKYSEFVADLDGKSELSITTYPAFFQKRIYHIPYLYGEYVSHEKLYFQVFIRDKIKKYGSNPNIESIQIHTFSYKLDDQESVELISEFNSNFWKQEQQGRDSFPPILFHPDSKIEVEISLSLNGQKFTKTAAMIPITETKFYPLIFYSFN